MTVLSPRALPTIPCSPAWTNGVFLVVDTETTGTDPKEARVVELGTVLFHGPRIRAHRRLVHPGGPIPPEATAVHGISDAHVADAPPFGRIASPFVEYLTAGYPLVGYNALAYDLPVLNAELSRSGHPHRLDPAQVLDVLLFVRWHLRDLRDRKLADLCALYGIPLDTAHSATADAQATGMLAQHLVAERKIPEDWQDALGEQRRLAVLLEEEWTRWSFWLYRSRSAADQRLVVGCGKHCGVPLCKVDPGYCRYMVGLHHDPAHAMQLPAEVVRLFELRASGQTDGAVIHG